MTIAQTNPRVAFNCNGTTNVFPVNLQSYLAGDFQVWHTTAAGAQTQLTLGTDYTLAAVGSQSPQTWQLTTTVTYPAGDVVQIIDAPNLSHSTKYNPGQAFPSAAVQQDTDRMTQLIQRIQDLVTRCIGAPDGDVSPLFTLPTAQQRANTNLGFGPQGQLQLAAALIGATLSAGSIGSFLWPVLGVEGGSVTAGQYEWGDIRRYGADTSLPDSAPFIRSAYATALNVKIPNPTPGTPFMVGSPIVQSIANQHTQWDGTLKATLTFATAAQTPTPNNNNNAVNNFVFSQLGSSASITATAAPAIDGNFTTSGSGLTTVGTCIADGLQLSGNSSGGRQNVEGMIVQHFPNNGIAYMSSYAGDTNCQNCYVQQWNNGDTPWQNPANYTANGVYFNRPDVYCLGITARWCGVCYRFGPNASTCWLRDVHPYNGTFAGNSFGAPAAIDPVIIRVDEGASGIFIMSSYLDSGHIDLYSTDVHIIEGQPLQNNSGVIYSQEQGQVSPNWIRVYAGGKGFPYDLDIKLATAYLNSSNSGPGNGLPTAFIGFYPAPPLNLLSCSATGGTGTVTYTATSNNAPQINSAFFLAGVGTTPAFNNVVAATATANGGIYQIVTVGSTDYTKIGAALNAVGHIFYATGAGLGTGTCALAYVVAGSSQTAGGAGVGVVTLTFANAPAGTVTGTGGTLQRSWAGNMNGYDSASGLLPNNSHQQLHVTGGRYCNAAGGGGSAADVLHYNVNFTTQQIQCGNQQASFWGYGNQPGGQPFSTFTTGFLSFRPAPFAGSYQTGSYPAIDVSYNLTGTSVGDDGSTNGLLRFRTQNAVRFNMDGFSSGVQSLYPATDNYMNIGYISPSNKRIATVYCVNAVSVTSDAREKTDISPSTLGLEFIDLLEPVSFKWKVGGTHIEHGHYIDATTGEDLPDFNPTANMEEQDRLRAELMRLPQNRRTEEQEAQFRVIEAKLKPLVDRFLNVKLTPEIETPIPGKRTHYGITAQNVKAALDALGITDHAGYLLSDPNDPNSTAHLRIDEIAVPALIVGMKQQKAQITDLTARLAKLESQPKGV